MLSNPSGSDNLSIPVHSLNAPSCMLNTPSGITTSTSDEHRANAPSAIFSATGNITGFPSTPPSYTVESASINTTLRNKPQPSNAEPPISLTSPLMLTLCKPLHPANACDGITFKPRGNVTATNPSHRQKADGAISVTRDGKYMTNVSRLLGQNITLDVSALNSTPSLSKKYGFIESTRTDTRLRHRDIASSSITCKLTGNRNDPRESQSAKALLPK